ncbi:DUF1203 domain-containing protein [Hyphococcus sp.]|uniref:DUF1203 domain-containing protein n=1 Tax=Hyphococcus sp. TaxID=2038636 RepID=UPI00207EDC7D|nr:MAG: hypothetical protein DHS20C04_00690 [Marinicaulis sp.]
MSFMITGLPAEEFTSLFALSDAELEQRGVIRKTAVSKPGYPCRVTLEDAEPGETVLLLNYESHKVATPYRSSYAIYVREGANNTASYTDELPPVFLGRPIALRIFDANGLLIGADLALANDAEAKINHAFKNPAAAYLHAHNAAHGCFAAEIRRAG